MGGRRRVTPPAQRGGKENGKEEEEKSKKKRCGKWKAEGWKSTSDDSEMVAGIEIIYRQTMIYILLSEYIEPCS